MIDSSGKTTAPAPCCLARLANSTIFRVFSAMSPTVGLICARPMRMRRIVLR
jgi:hypothetical protein